MGEAALHSRQFLAAFASLMVFGFPGCKRSDYEKERIMYPSATFVSHCVGRYLVDLPNTAEFVGSTDRYEYLSVEIGRMEQSVYEDEVNRFEQTLRGTKHIKNPSLLLGVTGKMSRMPVYAYWEEDFMTAAIDLAGYRWLDGFRYRLHTIAEPDRVEQGSKYVSEMVSRLHPRGDGIPIEKGFCIRGAMLVDDDNSNDERTSITFRLRDKPDVVIEMMTSRNGGLPPETLLSRKPGVLNALSTLGALLGGLHTIREGGKTLAGVPGEEWLIRAPNDYKFQSHLFTWEAPGKPNSVLFPQIRVELRTASYGSGMPPAAPSLSDQQALQLWDQILSTLRLRQTVVGPMK